MCDSRPTSDTSQIDTAYTGHPSDYPHLTPVGERTDPWKCFYGNPGKNCICGYCRFGIDSGPEGASWAFHVTQRQTCGHRKNIICACTKIHQQPISEHEAYLLLARSAP